MDNAELLSVLNQYIVSHQAKYGIKRQSLFGSATRDTITGQGDIDIVVELEKQDLFFMTGRLTMKSGFRGLAKETIRGW
jgi:predicted nucleotidyltransferase